MSRNSSNFYLVKTVTKSPKDLNEYLLLLFLLYFQIIVVSLDEHYSNYAIPKTFNNYFEVLQQEQDFNY
jgi:hypothetical protein